MANFRIGGNYPTRVMCDVLQEMRDYLKAVGKARTVKTKSLVPHLLMCIEEIQTYGNRMESALACQHSLKKWQKMRSEMRDEMKKLKDELRELEDKVGREEKQEDDSVVGRAYIFDDDDED